MYYVGCILSIGINKKNKKKFISEHQKKNFNTFYKHLK